MATKQRIEIVGVSEEVEKILKEKANVLTIKELSEVTRTTSDRARLAELTNLPLANVAQMAAQAELMRVRGMTKDEAYDLIGAEIYSVEQFQKTSNKELCERIKAENPYSIISETRLEQLKEAKVRREKQFEGERFMDEMVISKTAIPSAYSDLSEIISELGKGIAEAQKALDQSSIDMQNEILENDELYSMGLQATWYAIPETEFTLKMDYAVSQKKTIDGKTKFAGLKIAPSNATFQNLFKSDQKIESTVRLKITPIPASDRFLQRRRMPDLSKAKSVNEIISIMEEKEIENYTIVPQEALNWGDAPIEITDQTVLTGELLKIGCIPQVRVSKKKR